jgi:hypothetical protein
MAFFSVKNKFTKFPFSVNQKLNSVHPWQAQRICHVPYEREFGQIPGSSDVPTTLNKQETWPTKECAARIGFAQRLKPNLEYFFRFFETEY